MIGIKNMYNSPDEFLAELKQLNYRSIPDHPYNDSEYERITVTKLKKHGKKYGFAAFTDGPLEFALKHCIVDFLPKTYGPSMKRLHLG